MPTKVVKTPKPKIANSVKPKPKLSDEPKKKALLLRANNDTTVIIPEDKITRLASITDPDRCQINGEVVKHSIQAVGEALGWEVTRVKVSEVSA